jgi:hypothetical protein
VVHCLLQQALASHQLNIQTRHNTQHGQPAAAERQNGGQDVVTKIALLTGAHGKFEYVRACALSSSHHTASAWLGDGLMGQPPPDSCRCIDHTPAHAMHPSGIMASGQLNIKAQVHATDMQPHVSCSRLKLAAYLPLTVSGIGPSKAWYWERSVAAVPRSARISAMRGLMLPGSLLNTCSRSR